LIRTGPRRKCTAGSSARFSADLTKLGQ